MKFNLSQTRQPMGKSVWLSRFRSISLAFCFAMTSTMVEAQSLLITSIEADENDRIKIRVEGPAGDYGPATK